MPQIEKDRTLYTASTLKRLIAFFIDELTYKVFFIPPTLQIIFLKLGNQPIFIDLKWFSICFLLQFLYRVFSLKLLNASFGKMLMGLEVVSTNKGELEWAQCMIRVVTEHLSIFIGSSFRCFIFFRMDRTHLADWLAETRVVQYDSGFRYKKRKLWLGLALSLYILISSLSSQSHFLSKVKWDSCCQIRFEL